MQKTFIEVASAWLEAKRPFVKHSTLCAYTLSLHHYLLPTFEQHYEITEEEVQSFLLQKLSEGLSRKSVHDIIAVLKSVVRYGGRYGIFPYREWQLNYPTTSSAPRKLPTLSLMHQRKLMQYLTSSPTSQNIGILVSLCTGMRIGEVCALMWSDIDFSQRIIRVMRTVGRVYNYLEKNTQQVISEPKTVNAYREIPISKPLYQALKTVRKVSVYNSVVGRKGGVEPRAYREYFHRLLKRLEIPKIVFHGLRHTFATRCIESKCDYKTLSTILGHSNVATTLNLYVHPDNSQKKRCIDSMLKHIGLRE